MAGIIEYRAAVVADIFARIPGLRECVAHPGRFGLEDLKRLALRSPAVRVAILSAAPGVVEVESGERDVRLVMGAFIVTADSRGISRDDAALGIAEALLLHVPAKRWVTYAHPAEEARGENLFSGPLDKTGAALWAVVWRQVLRLGTNIWADDGTLPEHVYLGMAPEIGIGHESDYTELT